MNKFEEIENKDGFYVHLNLEDALPQTVANYGVGHSAIVPCEIVGWNVRWGTASTSGTVALEKLPSGTAKGAGTVISNSISTAGTADIPVKGTLVSSRTAGISDRRLDIGDSFAIKSSGNLTNLKDLHVIVYLYPLGKGDYR